MGKVWVIFSCAVYIIATADWHKLMATRWTMRPLIARANGHWTHSAACRPSSAAVVLRPI